MRILLKVRKIIQQQSTPPKKSDQLTSLCVANLSYIAAMYLHTDSYIYIYIYILLAPCDTSITSIALYYKAKLNK